MFVEAIIPTFCTSTWRPIPLLSILTMMSLESRQPASGKSLRVHALCTLVSCLLATQRCQVAASNSQHQQQKLPTIIQGLAGYESRHTNNILLDIRGGATSSSSSSKKKKSSKKTSKAKHKSSSTSGGTTKGKKKKTPKSKDGSDDKTSEGKKVLGEAMEKDAAEALGDAIR